MLTWAVCYLLVRTAKHTGMASDGAGCVIILTAILDVVIIAAILETIIILTGHPA